ncbi:unnamed protein product [Bursaphelenchus okinawaensis]|uniref:UBC core domain-containing protein n=1 Tax=Bursaphelenchus okinawaensis TaxID=465554 RepID=A0A811JTU2_9BILA|nr:unnamed protein product [Bursaphelenchus okinawaensis]CAG9082981.1 unnamed protein product [Bursaphelenchus okinawaensis]
MNLSSSSELHTPHITIRDISECSYKPQESTQLLAVEGNIGSYLLVEENGQISSVTDDFVINPVADFRIPIKVAFSSGCISFVSRNGFGYRSLLTNHSSIKELAANGAQLGRVFLELTKDEAEELSGLKKESKFSAEFEDLQQRVSYQLHECQTESFLIEINVTNELIQELRSAVAILGHSFSHGQLVIEKLRFLVDPFKAYNVNIADENLKMDQDVTSLSTMNSEAARRLSFYKWPKSECLFAQPRNLANAGFFLRPSAGNLDRVCCFSCGVCLVNWEPQDVPIREHVEHNPNCAFMTGVDKRNIPYESTKAILPMLSWSQIEGSKDDIVVDDVIMGNSHPNCSWVATAVSPLPGHSKPSIFLFEMDKVSQKPIEILLDLYATCMAGSLENTEDLRKGTGAFDWLNSVNDISNMMDNTRKNDTPLCNITSLCTTSSLDDNVQITNNDKIVAMLCTSVLVDEFRLKKSLSDETIGEEVINLNAINTFCEATRIDEMNAEATIKRRPFILVHHIVEFPGEAAAEPLTFVYLSSGKRMEETPDDEKESLIDITKGIESDNVPVYYNAKETVAVGIQCIRLPAEYDNTDFKVSKMHFSENGTQLLVVVDPSDTTMTSPSSLLVYSRIPSLYMFKLTPAVQFHLRKTVKEVRLLGCDYFGASTTSRTSALSSESLNETILIHYTDGTLELMDLDFGRSVPIEVGVVHDVAVKNSGVLMVLTEDGKFHMIDIQNSVPTCHSDRVDEILVSELSSLHCDQMVQKLTETVQQLDAKKIKEELLYAISETPSCGVKTYSSLKSLFDLVKSQPLCQQSLSTSDRNSSGTAINLQNSVGVSLQTSSDLVEYVPGKNKFCSHNLEVLSATNCQEFSAVNKYPYNEIFSNSVDGTRVWQCKVSTEQQLRLFVMEMTVSFGFNLSHVNINMGFSGFVKGTPDIKMTLYIANSGNKNIGEDLGDALPSLQSLPGPSTGFSIEHCLDFLSKSKNILENNCEKLFGPVNASDFIDGEGKQAVVQLSTVQLLLAAAAVSKKNGVFKEGWLADTYRFYILFEVNETMSETQTEFCDMQSGVYQYNDGVYLAGSKRSRNSELPFGSIIPLPQGRLTISGDKRKLYTKTKFNTRKRSQALSMMADMVTTNILDPFCSVNQKRDGLSALEYVAVSLFQFSNCAQRLNYQRCLACLNSSLHTDLVDFVCGTSGGLAHEMYYKAVTAQLYALDTLQWIITNLRILGRLEEATGILKRFTSISGALLHNGFVVAPRSVAHKLSAMLNELADTLITDYAHVVEDFLCTFITEYRSCLKYQKRYRNAGALQYLNTFVYGLAKLLHTKETTQKYENSIRELENSLADAVLELSQMWHSKKSEEESVSARYDKLNDIYAFDSLPSFIATVVHPEKMKAAWTAGKGTFGAVFSQSDVEKGLSETRKRMPTAVSYKTNFGDSSNTSEKPNWDKNNRFTVNTALSTMFVYDESKDVEATWFEHAGICEFKAQKAKEKATEKKFLSAIGATRRAVYAGAAMDDAFKQIPAMQSTPKRPEATGDQSLVELLTTSYSIYHALQVFYGRENVVRFEMGGETFPGLLESERLCFVVSNSTHHVRILDLNANSDVKVNADVKHESITPLPMDVEPELDDLTRGMQTRFEFERKRAFMPSQSKNLKIMYGNARSTDKKAEMFKGLAEMYVLGCHNKFVQNTTGNEDPSLGNDDKWLYEGGTPDTDGDGIGFETDDDVASNKGMDCSPQRPTATVNKSVILKRPPFFVAELENCHPGQMLQITLDLQIPALVTDFILPANEILSAVAVDGWLDDERNKVRYAYSTEIERRTLMLNDLRTNDFVRYLRLSFTMRDSRKGKTTFAIGNVYGVRFVSPWHLYSSCTDEKILDMALKKNIFNVRDVENAITMLRRRFDNLVVRAKKLMKQGSLEGRKLYNMAMADRTLFNTFNNILQRSVVDMKEISEVFISSKNCNGVESHSSESVDWHGNKTKLLEYSWAKHSDWNDASPDELRTICLRLMQLTNDITVLSQNFKKMDRLDHLKFDLNGAVLLFGSLISDADPAVQAKACAYLFHQGSRVCWWPEFFPAVIQRYFVNGMTDQMEDAFSRLVYLCCHTVQHTELRTLVLEQILTYIVSLIDNDSTCGYDSSKFSWTLLLLSNVFDVVVPNTRNMDRWAFLSGQSCMNYTSNFQSVTNANRRYARKVGAVKDNNYFSQPDLFYSGTTAQPVDKTSHLPIEQSTYLELRRMASDIKVIGKEMDTKLHNNLISPDNYHLLKKEQKQLNHLYHNSQTFLTKGPVNFDALFETVLNSPPESTLKAPLATHEEDEESNADNAHYTELMQRIIKLRKNLHILLKKIKYSYNSRKKMNENGVSRSRRFAIRMKLRGDLVVKTIQLLANMFCAKSNIMSRETQLLLFKLCAKLSVHGAALPISFREVMVSVEKTKELLATVFENADRNEWIRHAFLCFVLDVVESENSVQATASVGSGAFSTPSHDMFESEPNFEAKIKRRKDDPAEVLMEEGDASTSEASSSSAERIEETVYSKTLVTSGLLDPSSSCGIANEERDFHPGLCDTRTSIGMNPPYPFSFNLLDNPNEEEVDLLIFMTMLPLKPLELKTPPVWNNYRQSVLRMIAYNVARAHYDRGEPLSDIFRWFDYVMGAEMEAANASSSEGTYMKWALMSILNSKDFIEREFNLSNNKNVIPDHKTPSHSALDCAIFYSDFYSMYESSNQYMDVDDEQMFLPLDDRFEEVYNELVQIVLGTSKLGSLQQDLEDTIRKKTTKDDFSGISKETSVFYDECDTTYLPIDCNDEVLQYVASHRVLSLNHSIFAFSKLRFIQSVLQIRRCARGSQLLQCQNLGDLLKNVTLSSYVKPVNDVVVNADLKKSANLKQELENAIEKYDVDMELYCLNAHLCPFQRGVSSLSNVFMEHRAMTRLWKTEIERKVLSTLSYQAMSPSIPRNVKSSTIYDSSVPLTSDITCCGWICQALSLLIVDMNVEEANLYIGNTNRQGRGNFLEYLVGFFSELEGNVLSNKMNMVEHKAIQRLFVLSEQAVNSLMKFVVEYDYSNADIWVNLFKILIAVDAPLEGKDTMNLEMKNYKFTHCVENSVYFGKLLSKFMSSSLGKFSTVTNTLPMFGPSVCAVFRKFMQVVFTKQPSQVVMDSVLKALTDQFNKSRQFGYLALPVDVIVEITSLFDSMEKVGSCDPGVFVTFLAAFIDFTEELFSELKKVESCLPESASGMKSLKNLPPPLISSILETSNIPSNMCFSMILNGNMQKERNYMFNQKLKNLDANANVGSKSSKNITFVKRADILENPVRDGDVNISDLFMNSAYSMMRMAVRYVSQYRPHILKSLLHSQGNSVKKLIDMLFMFVSFTQNLDQITKDSFKIITLADAVVHLLLIISETSMEDPECCRLFIRIVLKTLRSRVGDASSSQTLMDLPIPVLVLMNSLLKGVSRCQIFVDEGGHTFVAEQLHMALEACTMDWPPSKRFRQLTSQLNMLSTHFTGVEPLSSNLPYNHTAAAVDDKVTNPTILGPQAKDGFNTHTTSEPLKEEVKYGVNYPFVHLTPNAGMMQNHPVFGNRLSISVRTCGSQNTQSLPFDACNFTPTCLIKSDTAAIGQLSALNLTTDKRGRVQTFQHKFVNKKNWLDLTFTLPYKVVLYEIAIKIPEGMTHLIPSAVQVELCSDSGQRNWHSVSTPIITKPVNHIRIPTYAYKFPVTAARIHMKAPSVGNYLQISQVYLLGSTSASAMRSLHDSKMFKNEIMNHWVSLFSRLCARIDVPLWKYAPSLSEALIRVYLHGEHQPTVIRQIHELLLRLDNQNKPGQSTLISMIVDHLINGGRISSKSYLSVAELLYVSCVYSSSSTKNIGFDANRPIHVIHGIVTNRQKKLLHGVERLLKEVLHAEQLNLESTRWIRVEVWQEVSVFLWATACAIWNNVSQEATKADTVAACMEISPILIPLLCNTISNYSGKCIFDSSCWLLCTLVRASPALLTNIISHLKPANGDEMSPLMLKALSLVCQSQSAVKFLIERNFIQKIIDSVGRICTSSSSSSIKELILYVDCLSKLMSIDTVIEYFDSNEGGSVFRLLIDYVVKNCNVNLRGCDQNGSGIGKRLVDSSISTLKKCLAYGGGHRERIALILSDMINQISSSGVKGIQLPETLETFVIKLVICDESIPVRLTGVVHANSDRHSVNFQDRMTHPLFGCNQDDCVMEVSLGTLCEELLPCKKNSDSKATTASNTLSSKAHKLMDHYIEDFFLGSHLNMVDEFSDEKESVSQSDLKPKSSSEASEEYPFSYQNHAIQLSCGAYSTKHALNNKWSLAKVVDGLRAIKRFNHKQNQDVTLLEKYLRDEHKTMETERVYRVQPSKPSGRQFAAKRSRTSSTSAESSDFANEGELTDGYVMLNLKVRASLHNNILNMVEDEPLLTDFLSDLPSQASTLLKFARAGGLKALSNCVDVIGRVDSKLKNVLNQLNKFTNPQLGSIKDEIVKVRRTLVRFASSKNQVMDQEGFSAINAILQRPIFAVLNALRILSTCESELKSEDTKVKPAADLIQDDYNLDGLVFDDDFDDNIFTNIDDFDDIMTQPTTEPGSSTSAPAKLVAAVPVFSTYDPDELDQIANDIFLSSPSFNSQVDVLNELPPNVISLDKMLKPNQPKNVYVENFDMIVIALSVFLEIDVYGPSLVEYCKASAKKLMYIMLGLNPPEESKKSIEGLTPLLPQSAYGTTDSSKPVQSHLPHKEALQKLAFKLSDHIFTGFNARESNTKNEASLDQIALVPFFVLSKCFETYYPPNCTMQEAESVRIQTMNNGTIDVLMTLLSYYSHQNANKKPIRPSGDLSSTRLLEQMISFNEEYQQIIDICSRVSKPQKPLTTTSGFSSGPTLDQIASTLPMVGPATSQLLKQFGAGLQNSTSSGLPKPVAIPVSSVMMPSYIPTMGPSSSKPNTDNNFWAKGTGFGSGNTNTHWNLNQHVLKQKQHEVTVTCLFNILTNIINPMPATSEARLHRLLNPEKNADETPDLPCSSNILQGPEQVQLSVYTKDFCDVLANSCLINTLSAYMLNDSVLDISCHSAVYESVVALLLSMCKTPLLKSMNGRDEYSFAELITSPNASQIYEGLKKICKVVGIYMSRLNNSSAAGKQEKSTNDEEEALPDLLLISQRALGYMEQLFNEKQRIEDNRMDVSEQQEVQHPAIQKTEEIYMSVLESHQFQSIPFFRADNNTNMQFGFHYQANLSSAISNGKRTRRLAQEVVSLSNSLPLSLSSSVFVRAADERLDVMKVLITGPADTPYSGGCFEFDVFFPAEYPTVPMMMNLQTTGNRTVRFNPNLYEEGKVCLSILNTWSGRPEERWNPTASSFLQVLVSIQSLILVSEPYFNEPGFERSRGTATGDQANREYTANIRHQCVRWAMIEALRNPPKAFEDVIKRHFWIKRDEICAQINDWIKETKEMIEQNKSVKVLPQHLTLLEKNYDALMVEFAKLECPDPALSCLSSLYMNEYREKNKTST